MKIVWTEGSDANVPFSKARLEVAYVAFKTMRLEAEAETDTPPGASGYLNSTELREIARDLELSGRESIFRAALYDRLADERAAEEKTT